MTSGNKYSILPILIFAGFVFSSCGSAIAQELNCQVSVLTPQLQETNKQIYETMQSQIREFMNSRKWTGDNFENNERIECSITLTINERVNTDNFKATLQVQSRRPVYKSSYNSPMINHQDQEFNFRYVQDQILEFDENSIGTNLTAGLAYYAYIIIGLDYDSYSPDGGTPYFLKAQTIVSNAQQLNERGWKAFENQHNRFWLVENLLNGQFRPMRTCIYKYHRLGFDKMSTDIDGARATVFEALKSLRPVYDNKPGSFLMQFFFTAKSDEIVSLFKEGTPEEKTQVMQLLNLIDPGNIAKYNTIPTGK